jgi:hypothetical protein
MTNAKPHMMTVVKSYMVAILKLWRAMGQTQASTATEDLEANALYAALSTCKCTLSASRFKRPLTCAALRSPASFRGGAACLP